MADSVKAKAKFRDAAVVVLLRGQGRNLECFWVRRSDAVAVQPGFFAFLGGKVDAQDAELRLAGVDDAFESAARVCAIREALEEAGVLIALADAAPAADLAGGRAELLAGSATFPELAQRYGWRFDASQLVFAGRWQTPVFAPVRFDTLYFLARVADGQQPSIVPGELAMGEWVKPADAIARWERGEASFVAPILAMLREITAGEEGLAERALAAPERSARPGRRIEMQHGALLHPMRTRPLPPAQHTNAYLIGDRDMILLDPGSDERPELESLFTLIDSLAADGRKLASIVVSHHHPDHTAGVAACRERYRVPVAGHAGLAKHLAIDRVLADGEALPLAAREGTWTLTALATPGHSRDSISLWWPRNRSLFCGDLVPGGPGSVIIDPPDGDLAQYLASLERCAALAPETLFPAHGSPQGAAVRRIRALIAHRLERETRVLAALGAQARTIAELLPLAYADVKPELWPLAERSLLAHLLALLHDGRASRDPEGWRRP